MRCLFKLAVLLVLLVSALVCVACNLIVSHYGRNRIFQNIDALPPREVALVLGTSPVLSDGKENPFFENRIAAAAELYRRGKARRLLVSGDNRRRNYNEPVAMRDALVKRGVPARAITLDYAGLRTLDSIVRAKEVFGLTKVTIISQCDHDQRALLIADHFGLDAIAYCARDVALRDSLKTHVREWLARVKVALDLYVLHTKPRHLGPRQGT
jgi:SanA protein